MEQQMDTLKVYKHYQHARLQKEGDDMWISSEDLRTEGSSDEDTQNKSRPNKRSKKQRKSDLLLSTSSNTLPCPKSSGSDQLTTKDGGCFSDEKLRTSVQMPSREQNISFNMDCCSVGDSPFSPDVYLEASGPSTSGLSLGSTDSDMDALNLESRWRPKRGSLKYPILVEGQTTENYVHEINGFYTEMMTKLKSLRDCPVLCQKKEILDKVEAKTFKYLKETPQIKETLKTIEKFDKDIKETIEIYKLERLQRLQAQNEMCNEISRSSSFVDGQLFLELCHFEVSEDADNAEPTVTQLENPDNTEPPNQQRNTNYTKNFIRRNIELAKEGIMAGCSLTDEEKKKLEDLLAESDGPYNIEDDDVDDSEKREVNNAFSAESDDDSDNDQYYISNAYVIDDTEKRRLDDINSELEKFTLDETEKEKREDTASKYDKCDWNSVLVEQRMKNIDAKLEEIRKSYEDEKAKDDQPPSEDTGNDSEVSDSYIDAKLDELYKSEYDDAKDDQISSEEEIDNFSAVSNLPDSEK